MDTILVPVSFTKRRAPYLGKVEVDAMRMYHCARYVIVIDAQGNLKEIRRNIQADSGVVDCLAVLAPFQYRGKWLDKVLVLEIGFRRFVPYAQTEYYKAPPKKRSRGGRQRKHEVVNRNESKSKNHEKPIVIKQRVPIAELSKDGQFDLLPLISEGVQVCVDDIVRTWTGSMGTTIRWVPAGTQARRIWMKHEIEPAIDVRIPKQAEILSATATFAEIGWRLRSGGHIASSAGAIKDMLKYFIRPGKRSDRDANGNFSDDYVRNGEIFHWVAERLRKKVEYGYSKVMMEALFGLVGPPGSIERKLVEQIRRVYKIGQPVKDNYFEFYQSEYGEMKELFLERWHVKNFRSLRRETKKKKWKEERTSSRPYSPHATNSNIFSVFASREAQDDMARAYSSKRTQEAQVDNPQFVRTNQRIAYPYSDDDSDIPWEASSPHGQVKSGTNNEDIPF